MSVLAKKNQEESLNKSSYTEYHPMQCNKNYVAVSFYVLGSDKEVYVPFVEFENSEEVDSFVKQFRLISGTDDKENSRCYSFVNYDSKSLAIFTCDGMIDYDKKVRLYNSINEDSEEITYDIMFSETNNEREIKKYNLLSNKKS